MNESGVRYRVVACWLAGCVGLLVSQADGAASVAASVAAVVAPQSAVQPAAQQAAAQVPAAIPDFAKRTQVVVEGATVALGDAVRKNVADPRHEQYRALRIANANSADGQLELARWCRKQKMAEEEKLHWWALLGMKPGHPEAVKNLQLRKYQGLLLTTEEIEQFKQQQKEADKAEREWTPKLKKMKLAIERGELKEREAALNELKSINDPLALPSVKKVFGLEDVRVGRQLVEMAGNLPDDAGAGLLTQMAVDASDQYVREKAAERLKSRPYTTYVPMLIARLAAPIELSYNVKVDPGRDVYKRVFWTGPSHELVPGMYNKIRLHSEYTVQDVLFWTHPTREGWSDVRTDRILDRIEYSYQLSRDSADPEKPYEYSGKVVAQEGTVNNRYQTWVKNHKKPSMADIEKQVKEANEKQELLNERIHAALTLSTGAKVVADDQHGTPKPQVWWDWWKRQTEMKDLFARGTEVWTDVGLVPIETVLVADRVLTRDAAKGELSFRLVIGTQTRTTGEMRNIQLDSRKIVATTGQRFMESRAKWKAVDELKEGVKLDGIAGPRAIESVANGNEVEAYGLVLADVPTFFVDRLGVLAHDASR